MFFMSWMFSAFVTGFVLGSISATLVLRRKLNAAIRLLLVGIALGMIMFVFPGPFVVYTRFHTLPPLVVDLAVYYLGIFVGFKVVPLWRKTN
jgi:ABC-type cobalamin transport system permease subunit